MKNFANQKEYFLHLPQVKKADGNIVITVINRDFNSYKKMLKCLLFAINTTVPCPAFFDTEFEIIYANIRV
ncbi:MAG: hypothetical protein WCY89_00335 [Flavobacteriaceae bacterium]